MTTRIDHLSTLWNWFGKLPLVSRHSAGFVHLLAHAAAPSRPGPAELAEGTWGWLGMDV